MSIKDETITSDEGAAVLEETEPQKPGSVRDELPPMLNRKEAADFAGVSIQTITKLCNGGALKSCRFGNRLRISRDAMLEYVGLA